MTAAAAKLLQEFKQLDQSDQRLVWDELAKTAAPVNYGQLGDDELKAIADQTLVLLDRDESDAQPR